MESVSIEYLLKLEKLIKDNDMKVVYKKKSFRKADQILEDNKALLKKRGLNVAEYLLNVVKRYDKHYEYLAGW